MAGDPNAASNELQQRLMLQSLLQNIGGSNVTPKPEQGHVLQAAGAFAPSAAAAEGLSRLYAAGEGLKFGSGSHGGAGVQQAEQQPARDHAADLQRLAQIMQAGQLPAGGASAEIAALAVMQQHGAGASGSGNGGLTQQQQQQQLVDLLRAGGIGAGSSSAPVDLSQLSRLGGGAAATTDNNLPSLLLWANLLQAYGNDSSRPNPLQDALVGGGLGGPASSAGVGGSCTSLKRTRDGELAVQNGPDRARLESFRHASLAHLQSGNWSQSLTALAQLSQALAPVGAAGGAAVDDSAEVGYAGYTVTRNNTKAGHWSEAEKQQLINLVQELKPTSAAQWEVVADLMGKWSPKGASAERMYRTLTDPGYYRATNKHGRRLNSRTSIPMYIKAVYALLQLNGHEGNLTQISDVIAKHDEFSRELDWTPRPGAKTYPRWKDALLSCFKEGRYPYLEKTTKKDGGSTVYRLKLEALKVEDVQKYVKYLEVPPQQLAAAGSLAGLGA